MTKYSKDELKALRKEAHRSEKLALRKIKRMAAGPNGYDVRGTPLNPRKGGQWIEHATGDQLKRHLDNLKHFRSPKVGWVSDFYGNPIRRQVFKNAQLALKARNKKVDQLFSRINDVKIPWRGVTVEEYEHDFRPKRNYLQDDTGYSFQRWKEDFTSTRYIDENAVKRWTAWVRRDMTNIAQAERVNAARDQFTQMADLIGDSELKRMILAMDDDQLWFAWSADRGLANSAKLVYESSKHLLNGDGHNSPDFYVSLGNDELSYVKDILRKASQVKLPKGAYDFD